ncbi:S8 family peptidase [Pseudomarimonas salicorniae]|uniref:S8 family peptidase n=1 Tax=Pseudomarimonas salicorniae TaxID=2933270 RepID=A0ABT0GHF1_9GAMM|nr:S8 family peptidase [Lysobacter sp. CAU 1642]MCK7593976.1 S8 family peptidase [Lysobacter sp. CAU 1642]
MNLVHRTLPVLIAGALGATSLASEAAELRRAERPIDGQYIVVLKDEVAAMGNEVRAANIPSVAQAAQAMAGQHGARMRQAFSHAVRGFVVEANPRALQKLLADDRVEYVEEDGIVEIAATQSGATWGIDRVDQRDLPLNGTYVYNTTASNVNTYIIDTGVLGSHSQFSGRMIGGYTAISDGRGTSDCNGHGTHVAGTVAGSTHGIAKGAKISPIRVLGCNGSGTNSGVIAGMDWVTANHVKPAVANMSLGGGASSTTDAAVKRMTDAGVVVVVAAGNDNSNACNYSPARAASAITVGSTTNTDARSSFSNYGSCLDIFAPGSSITSAWYTSNSATNTISGTSMASPHVAGVAALYLAANPTASVSAVTNAIINASTPNKVTGAQTGSPNRLLYSFFDGSGGGGGGGGGGTTQTYTNGSNYTIRDNSTVESPITVSGRSGNAPSATRVDVRIIHTYIGDLIVRLVAPDGSTYTLHNRSGGSADNIIGYYTVNLSSEAINGTWKLRVQDAANGDTGYIDSWSITF